MLPVNNLDRAVRSVRDKDASRLQVHVAVVESARGMLRQTHASAKTQRHLSDTIIASVTCHSRNGTSANACLHLAALPGQRLTTHADLFTRTLRERPLGKIPMFCTWNLAANGNHGCRGFDSVHRPGRLAIQQAVRRRSREQAGGVQAELRVRLNAG